MMPDKKDRDMWWAFKTKIQQAQSSTSGYTTTTRGWPEEEAHPEYGPASLNYSNDDEGEVEEALAIDPTESLPSPVHTPIQVGYSDPSDLASPSICLSEPPQLEPREPTTKILKLIDERTALHLLMYFTHWINLHLQSNDRSDYVPTQSHARWMFSLLSRVDDYVSADDMSLLRNLGRACIRLLQDLKQSEQNALSEPERMDAMMATGLMLGQEKMSETSCWMILTIITGIWKQRDLWDDARQALLSVRR